MRWPKTGLGRYLDGLLHGIAAQRGRDRLFVYYNSYRGKPFFAEGTRERFTRMPNRTLWNQLRLPPAIQRDRCDVFLAGASVSPVRLRIPAVLVVHDCLAFRDPAAKPGREGRYWRRWTRASAAQAARVVAVSESTAADCKKYLDVADDRLSVVHQGINPVFLQDGADLNAARLLLQQVSVGESPFFLQVGAYDPHKGGDIAQAALRQLRAAGRRVFLVQCGPFRRDAGGPTPGVLKLDMVDDATLKGLYRLAAATCVPSRHEGFGLPVLESMALGTPVVAARAGGLIEAGGEVALYFDPGSSAALATAMESLLDAGAGAVELRREEGRRWALQFTWERAASAVLDIIRAVAQRQ